MHCPDCGATVRGVATRGPSEHFLKPCGCRVSELTAREFAGGVDHGRGLATDGGEAYSGTERVEHEDIALTDDGDVVEITRIRYQRHAEESGVCPFCRSADGVEFVDEVGLGGTYRTQRFECVCGASGEQVWTWKAGLEDETLDVNQHGELVTDGGLAADNVLDACDVCEENQGVTSEDVVNEETGEMTSVWLCSECLDRLERYNSGEDDAFEDVAADGGEVADGADLYWGQPLDARRYHIFDGRRSLCGSWMFSPPDDPVTDDDTYSDGQDCKACCRAAGVEVADAE